MNKYVEVNSVKCSREKKIKPKITRDVLLKRKIKELGIKISPSPFKQK